ncbi:aminotransferase class III-fold pyridoxal phosphate-dependent enzyme, partial [bacterium]|nr:aminotransferase class III-fold pyridoxal phosphate-dependent enzyme [bacterium]
ITSAYVPLGLCATTQKIADHFVENYFAHGHTYEAHPLTLAGGVAAIGEYHRQNLLERTRQMGDYLGERLHALKARHVSVGEVRGLGLFWGVDLTENHTTRKPFNTYKDKVNNQSLVVDRVAAEMMKNGVFAVSWVNHLVIAPPLIVSREEIDFGIDVLDAALKISDDSVKA